MNSLEIAETIFPREHYTYRSIVRERENFSNNFWRDSRESRNELSDTNSQGYVVSQSGWSMDGRTDLTLTSSVTDLGVEGELQNGYSTF